MTGDARTETWVDKTPWGDGPWVNEPDRIEWVDPDTGYVCLALRSPHLGQWCGYVAVPADHPLHGAGWDDLDLWAHGGVNYSAPCTDSDEPAREQICHVPTETHDDLWWFGFDCAHHTDLVPGIVAAFTEPEFQELFTRNHTYRTIEYVQLVTAALARQLHSAAAK